MITMIMGTQGSGKSVHAVLMAQKEIKKGKTVYSNLHIENCCKIALEDLMSTRLEKDCTIILDEGASMGLGARGDSHKKNNKDNLIELFTMHRHYNIKNIIVISPSFEDVLPVIRANVNEILLVKKSILNLIHFNCVRKIGRSITLSKAETSNAPSLNYFYRGWFPKYSYRKGAYKMFNTFSRRLLEEKPLITWREYREKCEEDLNAIEKAKKKMEIS